MGVSERFAILGKSVEEALKKAEENNDEKFTVVVSNPPYQVNSQEGNSVSSIYHHYMNIAQIFAENISMVYPARWMHGGRGEDIELFRNKELNSQHYVNFIVKSGDNAVFNNVTIKGGVNYFLWTNREKQELSYTYDSYNRQRKTLKDGYDIMINNNVYIDLIRKINPKKSIPVYSLEYYGAFKTPEFILNLSNKITDGSKKIKIFYSGKGGGVKTAYIPKEATTKITETYKVFVSKTADPDKNGSLRRPGRIFIGEPEEICSGSFVLIQQFLLYKEAQNCLMYMKTDFATFLFGVIAVTQDATKKFYKLIPDIDFKTGEIKDKPGTFLNFDKPETLDEQLAKIYELTEEEQQLMKDSIRPWKDKYSFTADGLY